MDENTIVAMMQTIDELNKKYEDLLQAHNHTVDTYNSNFDVFRNTINKNFNVVDKAFDENADALNRLRRKHNLFSWTITIEVIYLAYKTLINEHNISALSKKVTGLSNVVAKELLKEENKKGE